MGQNPWPTKEKCKTNPTLKNCIRERRKKITQIVQQLLQY